MALPPPGEVGLGLERGRRSGALPDPLPPSPPPVLRLVTRAAFCPAPRALRLRLAPFEGVGLVDGEAAGASSGSQAPHSLRTPFLLSVPWSPRQPKIARWRSLVIPAVEGLAVGPAPTARGDEAP